MSSFSQAKSTFLTDDIRLNLRLGFCFKDLFLKSFKSAEYLLFEGVDDDIVECRKYF